MNIILLGPPGAGKGTQGTILQDRYKLTKISTGDLVREEISEGSELGHSIQKIVESGKYPSDDIIMSIVDKKLCSGTQGWIFDGIPRTQVQAEALDKLLFKNHKKIEAAIQLEVDENKLVSRITSRYTCGHCGQIYNEFVRPQAEGVCDQCESRQFEHRADDSAETLKTRLKVYHEKTEPLVDYYRQKGVLKTVDGMLEVDEVTRQIEKILDRLDGNEKV